MRYKKKIFVFFTSDSEGCNIVSDLAVHDIDMMVWMTNGELPESVYTIGHIHDPKLKSAKQPDTAVVTLKFKNGIMCTIDLSRDAVYGYDIRLEVRLSNYLNRLNTLCCVWSFDWR